MIKCKTLIVAGLLSVSSIFFILRGLEDFSIGNICLVTFGLLLFSSVIFFVSEIIRYHPLNDPLII